MCWILRNAPFADITPQLQKSRPKAAFAVISYRAGN
jgi:hypothetical protein